GSDEGPIRLDGATLTRFRRASGQLLAREGDWRRLRGCPTGCQSCRRAPGCKGRTRSFGAFPW
ncbi:hypothetical protein B8W95_13040, partial [Staphylococcus pasteuri]